MVVVDFDAGRDVSAGKVYVVMGELCLANSGEEITMVRTNPTLRDIMGP